MPLVESASRLLSSDPFVFYTLAAALFLAVISLVQGWLILDVIAIIQPHGLFHVTLAVLLAFMLVLAQGGLVTALVNRGFEAPQSVSRMLEVVSYLPLYVIALAYGPSAGLLAALLFAAFGSESGALGYPEMILVLELVVVGWFAIAPSPFRYRWAGPFNVAVAYLLTWATAGAAYLDYLTGQGLLFRTHLHYHAEPVVGLVICLLLLLLIRPSVYLRVFKGSRLNPQRCAPQSVALQPVARRPMTAEERAMIEPTLPRLTRSEQRERHQFIDPRQTNVLDDSGKRRR